MSDGSRMYEGMTLLYLDEDEADDASGVYVHVHEMIALLRCEALLAQSARERGDLEELTEDCLDAIADGLAEQAVELMDEVEGQ